MMYVWISSVLVLVICVKTCIRTNRTNDSVFFVLQRRLGVGVLVPVLNKKLE